MIQSAATVIELANEPNFMLGALRICPSSKEVISPDQNTPPEVLEPRVMQVLIALAHNRGEVVSRDKLVELCWEGRVVGDDAINRCTAKIRRLAEVHGGFTLETVPRVGYRLREQQLPESHSLLPTNALPKRRLLGLPSAIAIAGIFLCLIGYLGFAQWREANSEKQRRDSAVAQIEQLFNQGDTDKAFLLARAFMQEPNLRNQALSDLWQALTLPARPLIQEEGASIYYKPYTDDKGEWTFIGVSPLAKPVDLPRGVIKIKVEKLGFRTGFFAVSNPGPSLDVWLMPQNVLTIQPLPLPLLPEHSLPEDFVVVPPTNLPVSVAFWASNTFGNYQMELPAFAVAKTEVSNRQYKEFIDAGGYGQEIYWQNLPLQKNGKTLTWLEACQLFVDGTNRPGPANWQLSNYPDDEDNFPVTGISWFEAMAYARFRGMQLPTIHHWARYALGPYEPITGIGAMATTHSHFTADEPVAVNQEMGFGPWGTIHTSGNVNEWLFNFAGEKALAMGGAYNDYNANFNSTHTDDPWSRLPQHGVRLMQSLNGEAVAIELLQPITLLHERYKEPRQPSSDEAFALMRAQFIAPHEKPIVQSAKAVKETTVWRAEEITLKFDDNSVFTLYLFLPKNIKTPLQALVYGPTQDCCLVKQPNINALPQVEKVEYVVKGGRALVLPIWAGSYERKSPPEVEPEKILDIQRRAGLLWYQDFVRTLDYIQTRDDFDPERIGYLGLSFGANNLGSLGLALNPRLKTGVLIAGGLPVFGVLHPNIDAIHFAPRVTQPVLMINGRFDHVFPYEESQRPLFNLLATSPEHKKHFVDNYGHMQFSPQVVTREVTDWLDKYLGPVAKSY